MPKINKVTNRAFLDIIRTGDHGGSYDDFLAIDQAMGIVESPLLKRLKEKYSDIIKDCVSDIKMLAAIEEIIIQIRSKEVIESELRLSLSRDYIYARSTFYRRNNEINDIRVIAGKVDEYGQNLEDLLKDPKFRLICKDKLSEAMDKEIEININQINHVWNMLTF